MLLSELKTNPNNPRQISDDKLEKLKNSIKEFEKMMELRPIIIDEDNIVLGGNMRMTALKELGYTEIPDTWVKRSELTEDEKKRFIIEDNVGFGDWNWEMLESDWDQEQLVDWGLDVEFGKKEKEETEEELKSAFSIEIECENEVEQEETYEKLTEMGYRCKVLTL